MFVYYTMPVLDIIEKTSLGQTHLSSVYSNKHVRSKQVSAEESIVGMYKGHARGTLSGTSASFVEIVMNEDLSYDVKVFEGPKRFLKTSEPPLKNFKFRKISDKTYLHDDGVTQAQIDVQSPTLITIVNKAFKYIRYLEKLVHTNEDDLEASSNVQSGTSVYDPETYFNYVSAEYEEKLLSAFQDRHRNPLRGTVKFNGGDDYAVAQGGDSVMPTTPAEYQEIKADLMKGVLRKNKVHKINHVKCETPEGKGKGVLDVSTFVCFVELGDLPYVPMCQGEEVHLKGLKLSIDTFLVGVNNFRSVPVPSIPDKYENEENRQNPQYMSLELPINIDATNDTMVFNLGETQQKPVFEQAVDAEGNPVVDAEGNPVLVPVYEQAVDAEGNPVVQDGNPVYTDVQVTVDEQVFVDDNDNLLVPDIVLKLPKSVYGVYTSPYDLSTVIRANFEGGIMRRFRGMTFSFANGGGDRNAPYYIQEASGKNFITRPTPLAKLLGLNRNALLPDSVKFVGRTGDVNCAIESENVGYTNNGVRPGGMMVLSDDGTLDGFPSFETFTPLSDSDVAKIDAFAARPPDTLEGDVTIEVQHGPINKTTMLKDPQGYRNWVACVCELYKAATTEDHAQLRPWAKKEGKRLFMLPSWNDVVALGDRYGTAVYSEAPDYRIRWGACHLNDLSARVPNGGYRSSDPNSIPFRNFNRPGLANPLYSAFWYSSGKTHTFGTEADRLVPGTTVNTYTPDLSTNFGSFRDLTNGVEVDFVNYCDDPMTLYWIVENGVNVLKPIRRFQPKPEGANVVNGSFRIGVIKKSIVRRILNTPANVPDTEVPNYGYFRHNAHNAGGTHAGYPQVGGLRPNEVTGPWIMKYFNEMKCTRVITDNRGGLGGSASVLSLYSTYGTTRPKNINYGYGSGDVRPNRFVFHEYDYIKCYEDATGEPQEPLAPATYDPTIIADVFPDGLFDRDPLRYSGIDTALNPNPENTKKRHMFMHCGAAISMTQWQFFEHKQLDEEGRAYYREATDEDGSNILGLVPLPDAEQTVENMAYGTASRPFCTAGSYPTTEGLPIEKFNPNKEETESLAIQPLRQIYRSEIDPLIKYSDGSSAGQWGKHYQPDFLPDYGAITFMQDIGFTTDLLNNPVKKAVFDAEGGEEVFGTPIYPPVIPNDPVSDASTYIPAPAVMPDFFDPLTYRDRMLERAIWMMNQEDWRDHKSDQSWSTSNF